MEIDYKEFIKKVRKLNLPRVHKVNKSYGIRDGFRYYRKIKPSDSKYVLTDSQYYTITREINNILSNELINGGEIIFPYQLGKLELRKFNTTKVIKDGKLKLSIPVDWNETTKLWYNDSESHLNKVLVRSTSNTTYTVHYNKYRARFNNSTLYQFNVNRLIKRGLVPKIKEGKIDAFSLNRKNNL